MQCEFQREKPTLEINQSPHSQFPFNFPLSISEEDIKRGRGMATRSGELTIQAQRPSDNPGWKKERIKE